VERPHRPAHLRHPGPGLRADPRTAPLSRVPGLTRGASAEIVGALRAAGCVFAEDEARLLAEVAPTAARLADLVRRRLAGEPLEHVLGWAEFCGLRIAVRRGVFVPRRRSELLVELAVGLVAPGAVVVELCCGSGAIATALATRVRGLEVHAVDVDPIAVRCARVNLAPLGGRVHEGDLDAPLPVALRGRVDLVVANAPYVPTSAIALMPPEARDHEPAVALDGGADGLDVQRRVAAAAPWWLAPGGHLLIETSREQAPRTADAVTRVGLAARVERSDEREATVVVGVGPRHGPRHAGS
jgi:release factor glutamine methyltransferase